MERVNWQIVGAIALPNVGGIVGGILSRKQIKTWYPSLQKPSWTPPNWVFAPTWTVLYSGIGCASYLVFKEADARLPLAVYGTNLALNWAWTPIFFGFHKLKLATYEIALLDVSTIATGMLFYRINKNAGLLFIPYILWLGLATALTYTIYKKNSTSVDSTKSALN